MSATQLSLTAAKEASIRLVEGGEDGSRGQQAVHDRVTALRSNRRSANAHTKTRGEVRGSDKKPWRQKGTGRARHGSTKSPIWVGGGTVFGPRNDRNYKKGAPKKVRRLAFARALTARIEAGDVHTVNSFAVAEPKTKQFVAAVKDLVDAKRVLIIGEEFDETTLLAGRNVANVQLVRAQDVNVEELLSFGAILVTDSALAILATRSAA